MNFRCSWTRTRHLLAAASQQTVRISLRSLALLALAAAAALGDGAEMVGRLRQRMRASVAGLPNYTCLETMERSIIDPAGRVLFRERLRLEVLIGQKTEMFAWPGSTDFARSPFETSIGEGAIGSGNFGAILTNLFVGSTAAIAYAGPEHLSDRTVLRFDFHAPLLSSGYTLSVNNRSARTAYSGSLWVDQDSLDVVRLEQHAEEIPPELDCTEARDTVTYGRVRLGVTERLLPSSAELSVISRRGRVNRNVISFSKCHHFMGEASISFGPPAKLDAHEPDTQAAELDLPGNITLSLRLKEAVSTAESAAGDPIVASLDKDVSAGDIRLPKGARVLGRIRRLEQHFLRPAFVLVGLEFYAAETPGGRLTFRARLIGPGGTPDQTNATSGMPTIERGVRGLDIDDDGAVTGVGSFRVPGKELRLKRGFRTKWETQ